MLVCTPTISPSPVLGSSLPHMLASSRGKEEEEEERGRVKLAQHVLCPFWEKRKGAAPKERRKRGRGMYLRGLKRERRTVHAWNRRSSYFLPVFSRQQPLERLGMVRFFDGGLFRVL